ncbi:MAG TPA: hypothetical protein VKT29_16300 [Terriglobales bacterium]|nr:hypothetical protein [Terriglobales bacterium]
MFAPPWALTWSGVTSDLSSNSVSEGLDNSVSEGLDKSVSEGLGFSRAVASENILVLAPESFHFPAVAE